MGLLLSVLFSYVGAIELVFILRDIVHQIGLHQQQLDSINNNEDGLHRIQESLRKSISFSKKNETADSENVHCMEDGVQYIDGYRVESESAQEASTQWQNRLTELQEADAASKVEPFVPKAESAGSGSDEDANLGSDNSFQSSTGNNSVKTVIERRLDSSVGEDFEGLSPSETSTENLLGDNLNTSITNSDGYLNDASESSEIPDMTFQEYPEGYLQTLDGIKSRPLSRDASSRRRRVFKTTNSSDSSDMQRRASREEELQMFTSLEEEEFETVNHSDYAPIQYSSEPNLKAKHHIRRHKRSPVRRNTEDTEVSSSYRDSGNFEEVTDPWGEVKPEHFHNRELWERERTMSIVEDDRSTDEEREDEVSDRSKNVENSQYKTSPQNETSSDQQQEDGSNVSKSDDAFEKTNPAHETDCIECEFPLKTPQLTKSNSSSSDTNIDNKSNLSVNTTIIIDTDYITSPDLDEVIDDDKIQEFIEYIEKIDENLSTPDKLQFQDFQDTSTRLRHPSYNFSGKDDVDDSNLNTDYIQAEYSTEGKESTTRDIEENKNASIAAETDRLNSMLNPYTKTYERQRKANLYSRDLNRFLENEQFDTEIRMAGAQKGADTNLRSNNETQALISEADLNKQIDTEIRMAGGQKGADVNLMANNETQALISEPGLTSSSHIDVQQSIEEPIIKLEKIVPSYSLPVFRSQRDETPSIIDDNQEERDRSSSGGISFEIVDRQESLVSTFSSESSGVKFYQPHDTSLTLSHANAHEGSSMSTDSNILFQRSQSDISDLEYIKTRQDWRDRPNSIDVREEIDSDDYHHFRRHSEAVEMLEYIRGREDWLESKAAEHRHQLPRIYEHGDYRILIREEINSDEYHHNRQINEALQHALTLSPKFLVQGSARSGRERSPYKVLRADVDKNEFIERYYWKGGDEKDMELPGVRSIPDTYYSQIDISEQTMIDKEHLIWITEKNRKSRSQSPYAVEITIENSNKTQSIMTQGNSNDINEIIETLIESELIDGTSSERANNEQDKNRLQVLDRRSAENTRRTPKKSFSEPFIIISEATDDEQEAVTDEDDVDSCIDQNSEVNTVNVSKSVDEDDVDVSGNFEIINIGDQEPDGPITKTTETEETSSSMEEGRTDAINGNSVSVENDDIENPMNTDKQETAASDDSVTDSTDSIENFKSDTSLNSNTPNISNAIENESLQNTTSTQPISHIDDQKNTYTSSATPIGSDTRNTLKKTLKADNLEDLIQDVSMGPWFHK